MRIVFAYLSVVLIWTTTPLGIKWSGEGVSYILGVTARMAIGAACVTPIMLTIHRQLSFHSSARKTYFAVSLQIYLSMLMTYWAAQFIPSGWIAVIFGFSPFITAFLAAIFLQERSLSRAKLFAYALGATGIIIMFHSAMDMNSHALLGIACLLGAVTIHAGAAVWVKRIGAGLSALQQITGGLMFSLPAYLLSWFLLDHGRIPAQIPQKSLYAIVYLGIVATTVGFMLYYYLLNRMPATHVAMMNLITPALSLSLGHRINHEPLTAKIIVGTGLIVIALLIQHSDDYRQNVKSP